MSFIIKAPGVNGGKLFKDVIYECLSKARVFVSGTLFKPCLIFVREAVAYPSVAPKRSSPLG